MAGPEQFVIAEFDSSYKNDVTNCSKKLLHRLIDDVKDRDKQRHLKTL